MERFVQLNQDYSIRTEMHQGRKHLVVPVIMMMEGVHNGSAGPMLHQIDELGRYPESWNGIPIVIFHPERNGSNVSANSPDLADNGVVGRVYNTHVREDKLKAEAWLDEEKLSQISPNALGSIRQGKPLDVSVGVFTDEERTEGEHDGEHYEAIARNHRPDHLALLPGGTGACSWADGCGIRANKKGGDDVSQIEIGSIFEQGQEDAMFNVFKQLNDNGFVVQALETDEQELTELIRTLRSKLDRMDNGEKMHYLESVYDNYIVYEVHSREGGSPRFYKQEYQMKEDGSVEFNGDAAEVRKKVDYVAMEMKRKKFNDVNKKEVNMSENVKTPCCEGMVNELIANERTKFTEEDREWLTSLEQSQVEKLVQNEAENKPKEELPQETAEEAIKAFKEKLSKPEDFLQLMPEGLREVMQSGLKLHEEREKKMIKSILDNTDAGWTEDDLKGMNMETLEKVFNSTPKKADYSMQGGEGVTVNTGVAPMMPVGFSVNSEDKK